MDLLGRTHRSQQTLAKINHPDRDFRCRQYTHISNLHTIRLDHHLLTGQPTLAVMGALTRTTISLMDRATKGTGMNVAMGRHHEEDEGGPNRVVGEEEAVDEIGIEEGTRTGEIDKGMLVGRREAGGEVVLGGVNALGHENFLKSRLWNR